MERTVVQDGSGRLRIIEKDRRGEVESYSSPQVMSCVGLGEFVEKESIAVKGIARGQILITANVIAGAAFAGEMLALDVQVVGYQGTTASVVAAASLSDTQNQLVYEFGESETFDRLAIEARQNVDGEASGVTTPSMLSFSTVGTFWR